VPGVHEIYIVYPVLVVAKYMVYPVLVVVYRTGDIAATSEREREREEYSIQESDERMKESAIQQVLVRAPSSIEFRSELLRQIVKYSPSPER